MCGNNEILKKLPTLYEAERPLNFYFYTVYFGNNLLVSLCVIPIREYGSIHKCILNFPKEDPQNNAFCLDMHVTAPCLLLLTNNY